MSKYHLLIDKFLKRTISREERKMLKAWVSESDENMSFFKKNIKEFDYAKIHDFDSDLAYEKFMVEVGSKNKPHRTLRTLLKYAAVFAILLTIGILTNKAFIGKKTKPSTELSGTDEKLPVGNDIIIKMADGSVKTIKADGNEIIMDADGNIVASKDSNSLSFEAFSEEIGTDIEERFNEVYIPYGETFSLRLSDGTKVWLNAGSKLRFPQKFANSKQQRVVYLEGEAFFDVATDKERPFIVNTQELDIKVLGTEFNVSSYGSDDVISITLVEGSVSVYETRTPKNALVLEPSYQANYDKFGNNLSKKMVDTNVFTAWIQNKLVVDHLKFSEILVRLERRYHVKFVNNAEYLNEETYKGEFENENIESILKTIALSTPFSYEIDQNIITITE